MFIAFQKKAHVVAALQKKSFVDAASENGLGAFDATMTAEVLLQFFLQMPRKRSALHIARFFFDT
jgi:hypothetical protein